MKLGMKYALLAIGVLVALYLPNGLYPAVAVDMLCWALFAVAIDLLLGYTGLLSFGHAAFWGSSAYVTGLIAINAGVPFPLAVLGGALAAALLALPVGYLAVKRTGIYFAMVTLAFAQMVYYVANEWRSVTRGENGLQGVPRTLFGVDTQGAGAPLLNHCGIMRPASSFGPQLSSTPSLVPASRPLTNSNWPFEPWPYEF